MSRGCSIKNRIRPHEKYQKIIGSTFIPIIIMGFFWPWIGLSILACMILGMAIAIKKGRSWCDWMCPRGSFIDIFLTPISPQASPPRWLYDFRFRLTFISLLFTFLLTNIYLAWPDPKYIGFAFVKTLTITTLLSIILAIFMRARGWCIICPVGTFSALIGGKKIPLQVESHCINCTKCEKVCPMGLTPYKDKDQGELQSLDCIKCGTCVANCPVKALHFKK